MEEDFSPEYDPEKTPKITSTANLSPSKNPKSPIYNEQQEKGILNQQKNNLDAIDPKQRKHYISMKTWDLIEERDKHRKAGRSEEEQETNKNIKKQADEDKLCHTVNKLEQGANLKEKWQGIKDSKSKCVPTFTRQKDIRGNRVLPKKKAEAIAEYLSEIQ